MKKVLAGIVVCAAALGAAWFIVDDDIISDLLPGSEPRVEAPANGNEVAPSVAHTDPAPQAENYDLDYYDGGINGIGGDFLPFINIYEDRIVFGGNDITLAELEDLLVAHEDYGFIWEVRDAYQAAQVVYSAVIELFTARGISFIEN